MVVIFFFQAEDGIRDYKVTGVQTCALPIFPAPVTQPGQPHTHHLRPASSVAPDVPGVTVIRHLAENFARPAQVTLRSEERRVGKESGSRWSWNPDRADMIV